MDFFNSNEFFFNSTAYATMARSAVPKLFWARPKIEVNTSCDPSLKQRKNNYCWMDDVWP